MKTVIVVYTKEKNPTPEYLASKLQVPFNVAEEEINIGDHLEFRHDVPTYPIGHDIASPPNAVYVVHDCGKEYKFFNVVTGDLKDSFTNNNDRPILDLFLNEEQVTNHYEVDFVKD